MRVFFDLAKNGARCLDFSGVQVGGVEEAHAAAELLSIEFGVEENSRWIGGEVQVRDAFGATLFTYPVRDAA